MPRLAEIATVIRSKNAGPLTLSFDLIFPTDQSFEAATRAQALRPIALARLYNVAPADVIVTPYRVARAIKIAMPRTIVSGSPGDHDVYGAQQHVPLLDLEI
ncbi:MAG: DUF4387 domain-containing protein [Alcaligenaceae bacterium]|nr:DUF4387 domain-containing protein [Alcaligenaceae bacterium]